MKSLSPLTSLFPFYKYTKSFLPSFSLHPLLLSPSPPFILSSHHPLLPSSSPHLNPLSFDLFLFNLLSANCP